MEDPPAPAEGLADHDPDHMPDGSAVNKVAWLPELAMTCGSANWAEWCAGKSQRDTQ